MFLAIDPATRAGWACWKPGLERPASGTFELPADPEDLGRTGCALHRELQALHVVHGFERIYYEAPIPPSQMMGQTHLATIAKAFGIAAHIESFAYAMNLRCRHVSIATWRKLFLGKGAGESSKTFKDWSMKRCRELGWNPRYHDEADALGILDYAIGLDPDFHPPWRDTVVFARQFAGRPR
jgi:hypothetical protein